MPSLATAAPLEMIKEARRRVRVEEDEEDTNLMDHEIERRVGSSGHFIMHVFRTGLHKEVARMFSARTMDDILDSVIVRGLRGRRSAIVFQFMSSPCVGPVQFNN